MVQHVEEINAEVHGMPLVELEMLHDGKVPVLLEWSAERIARDIPKSGDGQVIRWIDCVEGHGGRRREAREIQIIQVIYDLVLDTARRVSAGKRATSEDAG